MNPNAIIKWFPEEEGGRKTIMPAGMRYCPIIVLDNKQSDTTLWSAAVFNISLNDRITKSRVTYLSNDAPMEDLVSGATFSLFESGTKVATGVFI